MSDSAFRALQCPVTQGVKGSESRLLWRAIGSLRLRDHAASFTGVDDSGGLLYRLEPLPRVLTPL